MVFVGLREDEDVIQINNNVIIQKVEEDGIHDPLEGSGRVGQSEGHYVKLISTVTTGEGRLVTIGRRDRKLVVPIA